MSLILRDAVTEFIERMDDAIGQLHEAIATADVDAQHTAFAAIVGLVEMLKSAADNGEPDTTEEDAS